MSAATIRPGPFASNEEWEAAGIVLPGPKADYRVASVKPTGNTTLHVVHRDGVNGEVRFEASAFQGVFVPLVDPAVFKKVHVKHGAVAWSDEIDLAPDNMHRHLFAFGEWVLQ